MHRVHSIQLSETDDGRHAILIELGGELSEDFEPVVRMELDKTLCRERQGGVVVDISAVTMMSETVTGRLVHFAKMLRNDGIQSVLVVGEPVDVPSAILTRNVFDAVVPSVDVAEDILDVSFT